MVAEGTEVAGCAVDGEAVVGRVAGVEGSEVVAGWAKPMDGTSNAARATPRAKFEINMVPLRQSKASTPVAVPAAKTPTVSTAKTTSAQASEAATMPTAEADAVPGGETPTAPAETAIVPAAEAPSVRCVAPVGGVRCMPASRRSSKSSPAMAEMSDRRTRSDAREGTAHVTAMPPFGPDRRERQDGRTDKRREGGRAEDN